MGRHHAGGQAPRAGDADGGGGAVAAFAQEAPEFRRKLEASGSTIAPPNVDMPRFLAAETAKYEGIVKFANIRE